jgi:DNA mismatch repair ATPase MutL
MIEYTLMQNGQAKSIDNSVRRGELYVRPSDLGDHKDRPYNNEHISSPEQIIFNPGQEQGSFPPSAFAQPSGRNFEASHLPAGRQVGAIIAPDLFKTDDTLQSKFARARFIGQFINKYLLFEADQSLFLVDQHAAQERIMFEKFENQINGGKVEIQPLLTPLLLKLSPSEKIAWEEIQEKLKDVGIETSLFDEDTLAIQSQPLLLKNIERAVRTLLSGDDINRCDRTTIARRACKASIVTGDKLDTSQADYQRKQLLACRDPFTCPHGRPTVVEIKESFLDKQFLRT